MRAGPSDEAAGTLGRGQRLAGSIVPVICLSLLGWSSAWAVEPPTPVLTLNRAFELAEAANPDLQAARLQNDVARAGIAVAGQRPNPDLLLEEVRETPHDAATLSQTLELGGKRHRRIELADATVASRRAETERMRLEVRNRVRRAFFELNTAERRALELAELRSLAERTRDTAETRYQAGDVAKLDTVLADLTATKALNDADTAQSLIASARASLNALLALPADTPTNTTEVGASNRAGKGETSPLTFDAGTLVERALAGSSALAVLDRGVAEQKARLALAHALRVPDAVIQGGVTRRAQPDFDWGWRAGLSLAIPIFTTGSAGVTVEERTLALLEGERRARAIELAGAVRAAAATAEAERLQLQHFRELILPAAAAVESMAEDAYRSGQTALPALLQALQTTHDLRLQAIQAAADYAAAIADLESAMGVPLP